MQHECAGCGKLLGTPDGFWKEGDMILFNMIAVCSLECAKAFIAEGGTKPLEQGDLEVYVIEEDGTDVFKEVKI